MINHVRNLLGNLSASLGLDTGAIAEEIVPDDFHPADLPGFALTVRRVLFGSDPDRSGVNYRLRQYMTVVHATTLDQYVTNLDPRVTYLPLNDTGLFDDAVFKPIVRQTDGPDASLRIVGVSEAPDLVGRLYGAFDIEVTGPTTVMVRQTTPPISETTADFPVGNLGSPIIRLGTTGHGFQLPADPQVGLRWFVESLSRPRWDLGDITASLRDLGEPNLVAIFGLPVVEPFLTFRNIWTDCPDTPVKLAAFLLAFAYRLDALRTLANG